MLMDINKYIYELNGAFIVLNEFSGLFCWHRYRNRMCKKCSLPSAHLAIWQDVHLNFLLQEIMLKLSAVHKKERNP